MKLFFAGSDSENFVNILKKSGAKNFLSSFYSLGCGKRAPSVKDGDGDFLLDSGGFSARQHGVDIDVRKYAEYLNRYKIKFAFNLDVSDLKTSLENFYYLNENTNTYIMPVYHGAEWKDKKYRDLIDYYVECFPFIALGGLAGKEISKENQRRFLDFVFSKTRNKTMVHGLGMTGIPMLEKYPWFCVDSTSWLSMSRFAQSKVYSEKMAKVRARTHKYHLNLDKDIRYWIAVEDKMTKLWEKRGVYWSKQMDFDDIMSRRKVMTYEEWKVKNNE